MIIMGNKLDKKKFFKDIIKLYINFNNSIYSNQEHICNLNQIINNHDRFINYFLIKTNNIDDFKMNLNTLIDYMLVDKQDVIQIITGKYFMKYRKDLLNITDFKNKILILYPNFSESI